MTPGAPPTRSSVAVVGAGLAGLAAAIRLVERGAGVTVFEAADRVGGVVRTRREEGFLAEEGPHSLSRPSPEVRAFLSDLGLDGERVTPDPERAARYIVRDGGLVPLPTSPLGVLTTPLLSRRGRLRLLSEPFRPRNTPSDREESVAELLRRRGMGQEVVDRFLDPFVAGVYAGDPERLSARHAFPALRDLEAEHGSLVRGLLVRSWRARRRAARAGGAAGRDAGEVVDDPGGSPDDAERGGTPFSFREGMAAIPGAMAARLGDRFRLSTPVSGLRPATPDEGTGEATPGGSGARRTPGPETTDAAHPRWTLLGPHGPLGSFDRVVLALPAHRLALLALPEVGTRFQRELGTVEHPPIALLTLGFPRTPAQHPLDGFGMLVPRIEGREILGALFPSTLFPGRAPPGHFTVATFVGGTRDPVLARDPEGLLEARVRSALGVLLGIHETPVFRHLARWSAGIPQVNVGHGAVKEAATGLEGALPGVVLAGSWRDGVAVGEALASGLRAGARIS